MRKKSLSSHALTQKKSGRLARILDSKEGHAVSRDGTRIYYKSVGRGLPIVLCNGMGVSTFFWKYFVNTFKNEFQVVIWDYRGHGHSDLPAHKDNISVEALAEDCIAVCDALKIKSAVFIGHSLGAQVGLEVYRKAPQRVAAYISCLGTFGRPMDFFYNFPLSKYIFELFTGISLAFPKQSRIFTQLLIRNPFWYELGGILKVINTGMASRSDAQEYIDHFLKLETEFITQLSRKMQAHSSEDVLKALKVPALLIGGEYDTFTPAWLAKKMHRIIPDSELFIIKKGSHAALVEQPELINLRIEKFIKERVLPFYHLSESASSLAPKNSQKRTKSQARLKAPHAQKISSNKTLKSKTKGSKKSSKLKTSQR